MDKGTYAFGHYCSNCGRVWDPVRCIQEQGCSHTDLPCPSCDKSSWFLYNMDNLGQKWKYIDGDTGLPTDEFHRSAVDRPDGWF